mmetsp:Transcript_26163/g.44992  ORF Transcript_26163/g.44992 Transcript_26163/m.44992 type:complete len:1034 (-) Transcript_26163:471-3572(-)|eukprot:CAMPEP_0196663238 /NCGR_PEP_ID=MMETSP1086-20130531/52048_1 /TAXON_ID=77921 /ORGANISM="Cyanoptyche  gloeocystis , Strain SAG4.97" /LENGTH=1033 /DNA_ID=CAMNT_0041998967 /DNA_START=79 /DNA_END=3180 /DNA_ORIENTATION=+
MKNMYIHNLPVLPSVHHVIPQGSDCRRTSSVSVREIADASPTVSVLSGRRIGKASSEFFYNPLRASCFSPVLRRCVSVSHRTEIRCGLLDQLKSFIPKTETADDKSLKSFSPTVTSVNIYGEDFQNLSDDDLRAKTEEFRKRLRSGETLDNILPEAFAVVREASARVLGLRHYDVQVIGGCILHKGQIAEMRTGEGKTLVATLPAYLNGLSEAGVHVVTCNDYLAKRDAELMGQVHRFLGLSVGLVQLGMTSEQRRRAYGCDITYVTNSELGFDYLRDSMALTPADLVLRPFNFCIVDEVDSILIDEARTPLILSSQIDAALDRYAGAAVVAGKLQDEVHYTVQEKKQLITLTQQGFEAAMALLGVSDLFATSWAKFIVNALKAKELYDRDVNYVVQDGEVVIVDEFTGRPMPGRRWGDGLHQAIESKEQVTVQKETRTVASITYQSLFKLFPKLAGMTGTASTEQIEFGTIYDLDVVVVPTNKPIQRRDFKDVVFKTEGGKFKALVDEVTRIHDQGRPILIGTTSVETSNYISDLLTVNNLEHRVLNAKPELIESESEIVAQAGRKGAITIATNIAARGTDILLGGNPQYLANLTIKKALFKDLLVAEDAARMVVPDDALFPGEASRESVALVDAAVGVALDKYGPASVALLDAEELLVVAAEKIASNDPVITALRSAHRALVADYAQYTDAERAEVLEAGGLHIIGTEKHESRRIDNQLRGRAGRQGDPGSTRFLLSLEDNLFRVFGGDKTKDLANKFAVSDEMPIESAMLTQALEKVQTAVEEYFFDIRQTLFNYDQIMSAARQAVYKLRFDMLQSDPLDRRAIMLSWVDDVVSSIVAAQIDPSQPRQQWPLDRMLAKVRQFIPNIAAPSVAELQAAADVKAISSLMRSRARDAYEVHVLGIDSVKSGLMSEVERFLTLQQVDKCWPDFMEMMKTIQESIGLQAYAGKNVRDVYSLEVNQRLAALLTTIKLNTVYSLFMYDPRATPAAPAASAHTSRSSSSSVSAEAPRSATPKRSKGKSGSSTKRKGRK